MHDPLPKFFDAVSKGQTGNVRKFLRQGANVNARDKVDGMTPLLKAASRRNYVVQKILLSHGAKASMKDPDGLTALHFEAESGDIESVMLLLAHQAPIDRQNDTGCTALHYAANRRQLRVVDLLVFCGADPFIENERRQTAISVCNNQEMKDIMQTSIAILNGIKNNDIFLQNVELYGNETYMLEKLELTIYTPEEFKNNSLSFLCRRVRPEYSQHLLTTKRKELLISDTFEYRISSTHVKANVRLCIPLYSFPDPFEEIYMKTNTGLYLKFSDVRRVTNPQKPGELKWFCFAEIDLTAMTAFCLVTCPKVERFKCDNYKDTLCTSSVDPFVQLQVSKGTFKTPKSSVSLEVIPSPIYEEEDFKIISSVSHFYDLNQSMGEQPRNDVKMKIPLPQDYGGEGNLYILGAQIDPDFYYDSGYGDDEWEDTSLDKWSVIAVNPSHKKGIVTFDVSHFSIYSISESKFELESDVLAKTSELCGRATLRKMHVCFLVLLRPRGNEIFDVVVECVMSRRATDRMNYWLSQRFLDQKPSQSKGFEAVPKTQYIIKLSKNAEKFGGLPDVKLEFHPKRKNFQQFQIKLKDPDDNSKVGMVDIFDGGEGMEDNDLTHLEIRLTGTPFVEDLAEDFDEDDQGFTRDKFLRYIAKELKEEWTKVCVLAGLTYQTVEDFRNHPKLTNSEKKFRILKTWRSMSKLRTDLGVPDLVTALARVGRQDLVTYINDQLQLWLTEKKEQTDKFYGWLEEAFRGPNKDVLTQQNMPMPMSDQYFVLLADKFGAELKEAGSLLNLSKPELKDIYTDSLKTSDEHKLLKSLGEHFDMCTAEIEEIMSFPLGSNSRILRMLVVAREKCSTLEDSFRLLLRAVTDLNLTEAKEWIIDSSKTWLMERKTISPYSHAVQNCIEETERKYLEQKDDVTSLREGVASKRESYSALDFHERDQEFQNGANYIPPRTASRMGSSRQYIRDRKEHEYTYSSDDESVVQIPKRVVETPSKQKITFKEQYDSDSSSEYGIHHKSKTPTFQRENLDYRRGSDASFRSGVAYTPLPEDTSLIFNEDEDEMAYQQDSDSRVSDMEEYIRPPDDADFVQDNDSYVSGRDIYTPLPGDPVGMAFVRDDNEHIFDQDSDSVSHVDEYTPQREKSPSTYEDEFVARPETSQSDNYIGTNVSHHKDDKDSASRSHSQTSQLSSVYLENNKIPTFHSYSSQEIHDNLETSSGFQPQFPPNEMIHDTTDDEKEIQRSGHKTHSSAEFTQEPTDQDGSDEDKTEKSTKRIGYTGEMSNENELNPSKSNEVLLNNEAGDSERVSDKNDSYNGSRYSDNAIISEEGDNKSGRDEDDHTFITHLPSSSKRQSTSEDKSDQEGEQKSFGSKSSILGKEENSPLISNRSLSPTDVKGKDMSTKLGSNSSITEKSFKQSPSPSEKRGSNAGEKMFGSKTSITERGSTSSLNRKSSPIVTETKNETFGSKSSLQKKGKDSPTHSVKSMGSNASITKKSSQQSLRQTPSPSENRSSSVEKKMYGSKTSITETGSTSSLNRNSSPAVTKVKDETFGSKSSLQKKGKDSPTYSVKSMGSNASITEKSSQRSLRQTLSPSENRSSSVEKKMYGSKTSITERGSTSSLNRNSSPVVTEVKDETFGSKSPLQKKGNHSPTHSVKSMGSNASITEKSSQRSLRQTPSPSENRSSSVEKKIYGSKTSITERGSTSSLNRNSSPVVTEVKDATFGSKSSLQKKGKDSPTHSVKSMGSNASITEKSSQRSLRQTPSPSENRSSSVEKKIYGSKTSVTERGSTSSLNRNGSPVATETRNETFGSKSSLIERREDSPTQSVKSTDNASYRGLETGKPIPQTDMHDEISVDSTDKSKVYREGPATPVEKQHGYNAANDDSPDPPGNADPQPRSEVDGDILTPTPERDSPLYDDYYSSYSDDDYYEDYNQRKEQQIAQ